MVSIIATPHTSLTLQIFYQLISGFVDRVKNQHSLHVLLSLCHDSHQEPMFDGLIKTWDEKDFGVCRYPLGLRSYP